MEIFIIEIIDADSVHQKLLLEFKKKNITNPKKLNAHCLSYLMLDRILRDFYKIENREIIFDNNGKPLLKSKEKHFSISHSEDFTAIAFSDSNCGIDIEKTKQRDFQKIAKRMNFSCKNQDEFYKEWTLFEAKYKLNEQAKFQKFFRFDNYNLAAVSSNPDETVEIYAQSGQYNPPSTV